MRHRIKAAAIIVNDEKILLVKHVHPITGFEWWVPPGGGMEDSDENIFASAIRETWEETGYNIKPKEIIYLREFIDVENDSHNLEIYIKSELIGGDLTIENIYGKGIDENYIKEARWIDKSELDGKIIFPEIIKTDEFWIDIKSNNKFSKYLGKDSL